MCSWICGGPVLTLLAVLFSAYCVLGLDLLEQLGWSSLESSQRVSFGSGKGVHSLFGNVL